MCLIGICWVSAPLFTVPSGPKHFLAYCGTLHTPVPYTQEHVHIPSCLSAYSSCPSSIVLIATSCKEKPQTPVKAEHRQGCMCGFSSPLHFCSWDSHLELQRKGSTVLNIPTPVVTSAVVSASQVSSLALGCSGRVGEGWFSRHSDGDTGIKYVGVNVRDHGRATVLCVHSPGP